MSQATSIEWTDATWNPIRGCSRVSEGCRNCYAESVAYRFSGPGQPYEGLVQVRSDIDADVRVPIWNGQIRFVEEHLLDPLRWKPILGGFRPRRIFVNSMSDLFHEGVTDEMLDRIFAVMALCPQHTFQVLTKRPQRMLAYFNREDRGNYSKIITNPCAWFVWSELTKMQAVAKRAIPSKAFTWAESDEVDTVKGWPLPNVWLGVSVENQKAADERIPLLLQTPAAVRFLSAEPLLGPVDLDDTHDWLTPGFTKWPERASHPALDWVICGGESGPGARPMHPDWARSLRDQCRAAGVPFFFKQWGEWGEVERRDDLPGRPWMVRRDDTLVRPDGTTLRYDDCGGVDEAVPMRRVGKKAAGHMLDGEVIQQFPEVRA